MDPSSQSAIQPNFGKKLGTSRNCTPARIDPFFCTFERTIRRVQKCHGPKLNSLILKSPTSQEVLLYSVSEILLSGSCGTGQFRIPCGKTRNIGYRHAPSITNYNCPYHLKVVLMKHFGWPGGNLSELGKNATGACNVYQPGPEAVRDCMVAK